MIFRSQFATGTALMIATLVTFGFHGRDDRVRHGLVFLACLSPGFNPKPDAAG
jgi:hypothetical protein